MPVRYYFVVACCSIFVHTFAPQIAGAQTQAPLAKAPISGGLCTDNADCPNGICGSDGICGLVNAAACTASVQCRSSCGTDGYCGLPAAVACTAMTDCRGNLCNADGICAVLMGGLCNSPYNCRGGVCQQGFCVPFCSSDSSCAIGVTYCGAAAQCVATLADGAACSRDAMCRGGLCGADGRCGGTDGQACRDATACRSGNCAAGLCRSQCAGDSNCATGRFCDASTQACKPVQEPNTTCSRNAMCRGGVCAADGLCGALIGQKCTDPQVCRSNTCSAKNLCAANCADDNDCDYVHYCSGGLCSHRLAIGAACSGANACLAGICNPIGTCGSLNGAYCANNSSCLGLACQPQDVRCGLVNGFPCTSSAQCRGGFCGTNGMCAKCTQHSDCPLGRCDSKAGTCSVDARYAGLGLQGGGCSQGSATGLGILAIILALGAIVRRRGRLLLVILVLGGGGRAQAQTAPVQAAASQGFALQRYSPTDAGQLTFRVERPWYAAERARLAVGLILDYAHKPLVYKVLLTGASPVSSGIINHQFNATLQVAGAWLDWLVLSAHLPFVLAESGLAAYGVTPSSPAVGTITLRGMARIMGKADHDAFSLHGGIALAIPEGGTAHAHEAAFGITPKLVVAGAPLAQLAYAASVGVAIRPTRRLSAVDFTAGNTSGTELQLGATMAYTDADQQFSVGPELTFDTLLAGGNGGGKASSSLEILLGGSQRWDAWRGGLAVGVGFLGLAGTPDWRLMVRCAWSPGAHDHVDASTPGDRDNDGILDADDACPDQPGSPNSDPQQHGCPGDRDGDGVTDLQDACPDVAPGEHPDLDRPGCPLSARQAAAAPTSGNPSEPEPGADIAPEDAGTTDSGASDRGAPTAADPADRQPPPVAINQAPPLSTSQAHKAPAHAHAAAPPALVTMGKNGLILAKPIIFKRRTAALAPESRPVLLAVAEYLTAHAEIRHVTVEAYTDNVGKAQANRRLSQKRAEAVRQFLLQRHIASRRIVAKGMGSAHPVAPNTNAANRQRNMRVTFVTH
jgi:OOP family OmpA-OmpF porin